MTAANAVLLIAIVLIVCSLLLAHLDRRNWLDLQDLLRGDDGKISRGAVLLLGSFGMGSWVVWKLATAGALTGEIFLGYCAVFAAPAITKLIVNAGIEKAKAAPAEPATVIGNSVTMNAPSGDAKA